MTEPLLLALCAVLAAAVVGLVVALRRLADHTVREIAGLRAEHEARRALLERRVGALEGEVATPLAALEGSTTDKLPPAPDLEFLITRVGSGDDDVEVDGETGERPDARLFADLVLRESVVKAASFAHGVRRGLSPEIRNKMWFEMRREVKRARKQRRADLKEAQRDWKARQRAALDEDDAA